MANMRKVSYKTITVSETPVTVPVSFTETVTYTEVKKIIKTAPPQPPVTIPSFTTEEIIKVITETLIQTQSPYPPVTYTKLQVITEQLPPVKIYKTQPAVTLPGETKEYTETVTEKNGHGTFTTIYPPVGTTTHIYTPYPTPSSSSSTSISQAPTTRPGTGTGTVVPPKPTSSLITFPGAAPAANAPAGAAAIVGIVVFLVLA